MSPIILPPLATTVSIKVPTLPSSAILTFTARDVDISPDDKLEIWTDAPGAEGWRAVAFEEIKAAEVVGADKHEGLPVLEIGGVSTTSVDHEKPTYQCQIPIPAGPCSFGYTYRITYASGHVQWLGYDGGNGAVVLETGGEAGLAAGAGGLEWNGGELGLIREDDVGKWKGFGVAVSGQTPTLHTLPASDASPLIFAHLHPSPSSPPFFTSSPAGLSIIPSPTTTISIPSLAHPTLSSSTAVITLGGPSAASDALSGNEHGLRLLDLEGEAVTGVWGFSFLGLGGKRISHLLFSNTSGSSKTGIIPIPSAALEGGKVAVWSEESGKGLIVSPTFTKFTTTFAPGSNIVLALLPLTALPGKEHTLIAPIGQDFAVDLIDGETKEMSYLVDEKVLIPAPAVDEAGLFSDTEVSTGGETEGEGLDRGMSVDSLTSVEAEDTVPKTKGDDVIIQEVQQVDEDGGSTDGSEDEDADEQLESAEKGTFFKVIWVWLKNFWINSGLAWLFGRREKGEEAEAEWREIGDDEVVGERQEDEEVAAGERTPLLSGNSTKVNTPYITDAPKMTSTSASASPSKTRASPPLPLAPQYKTIQTTKTRSVPVPAYLKYTFATPPPFKLLATGGFEKVKFVARVKGGEWEEVAVVKAEQVGERLERIELGVDGEGEGWEVKVIGA